MSKMFSDELLTAIRDKFHHVDRCPYHGARIFFENAGGSLTLKSVVEVSAQLAGIPDNQGRDNPASAEMMRLIKGGRSDMMTFLGADDGQVWVGESGTECLFRVIRAAVLANEKVNAGAVIGSTLEHPATASAAQQWAARTGREYIAVPHDPQTGSVDADAYRQHLTGDIAVATVIQTSPVTGVSVDLPAIVSAIREAAPQCFIIVDGIQHAPHGTVDINNYDIDAFAVSAYKVFSRHNYGFAWVSPRLSTAPHDHLNGTADDVWELGTRDAAEFATFSEVVNYFDWLGNKVALTVPAAADRRARLTQAAHAIGEHEKSLTDAMLNGVDGQAGLATMKNVFIIGGTDNPRREGLVSLTVTGTPSAQVVAKLGNAGIRVHIRKKDHYSANILTPLHLEDCVRVSMCHYNTVTEVKQFLSAMSDIAGGD